MRAVRCPKCNAMCLLAMVDGFKAAVDPTPLGVGGVRETAMAGRSVYGTRHRMSFGKAPSLDLKGLRLLTASTLGAHLKDGSPTLGEHVCGSRAFSSVPIDAPEKALSAPVCDLRRRGGWIPPASCPRVVAERTGVPVVVSSCDECDKPPFDQGAADRLADGCSPDVALMVRELGATVVSVEVGGRNVYNSRA